MSSIRDAVLGARDGRVADVKAYLGTRFSDPNYTDHTGIRLLHIAAKNRRIEIVDLLLAAKANPNVQDADGETPLYGAVEEFYCQNQPDHQTKSVEIVRRLLAAGAKPNLGWNLPLARAARFGNAGALRLLIDARADVNQPDEKYLSTALIEAVNGAQRAMVEALIAAGADVNQSDLHGQTPLIRAIENPGTVGDSEERRAFCLELAQFLVSKGANVNQAMDDGRSPLMCAVNENWPAIIRFLLDAGAKADHVDKQGRGLARHALDGALRLKLDDEPALTLIRSMIDAGAKDAKAAADWARQRGRGPLADAIEAPIHETRGSRNPRE